MTLKYNELNSKISSEYLSQNRRITNITELLLSGEGYVMRAMRCAGAREHFITGDGSDYEKFRELCRTAPLFAGNAAQFVCQYILGKFFDCNLALNTENCDKIWTLTADALAEKPLSVSEVLDALNIGELSVCTDISSELPMLCSLGEKLSLTLCPDSIFASDRPGYKKTVAVFEKSVGGEITDIRSFDDAMLRLLDRFCDNNCRRAAIGMLSKEDLGKSDFYHADLALKKAISTDGHITAEEARPLRRYLIGKFLEACRRKKINVMLEFSEKPLEILPEITLEAPVLRRAWLNFREEERALPLLTEGNIDICGDLANQLDAYAKKYAIGTLPPFFVGTANVAELCLHELYMTELKKFSKKLCARG